MKMEETRLAAFLREQMLARSMSQNEFARWAKLSPATMSAIRHGHTPTMTVLRQLAAILDVLPNELAELAGVIDPADQEPVEVPVELRSLLRRWASLPPERGRDLLRLVEQMTTYAEAAVTDDR